MTAYEEVGESVGVSKLVDVFYRKVLADPSVSYKFDGYDVSEIKRHMAETLTEALDGPKSYTGRDLAEVHGPLDINNNEFDTVIQHAVDAMNELGIPLEIISYAGNKLVALRSVIVTA